MDVKVDDRDLLDYGRVHGERVHRPDRDVVEDAEAARMALFHQRHMSRVRIRLACSIKPPVARWG